MASGQFRYEIYPPVGVARVGNAVSSQHDPQYWFIGPEIPGIDPVPVGGFKNNQGLIKRSAQRFRIYEFNGDKVVREITHAQGKIEWTVHVANQKAAWVTFRGQYDDESWTLRNANVQGWPNNTHSYAHTDTRNKLIVDSGDVSISGTDAKQVLLKGQFYGSKTTPIDVQLGALCTDDAGRLIVIPGDGKAYNMPGAMQPDGMDNDDWIDAVFDGHINATVTINGAPNKCTCATVISAPPHFGNGLQGPVSLHDLIEDIYDRQKRSNSNYSVGDVVYYDHIYPLFRCLYMLSWTSSAKKGHDTERMDRWFNPQRKLHDPNGPPEHRRNIFKYVRLYVVREQPEKVPTDARPVMEVNKQNAEARRKQEENLPNKLMPKLNGDGDEPGLSLTQLQYERLKKWSDGNFTTGSPYKPPKKFDDIPLKDQPGALGLAALQWSVGGSFFPGIECYWIVQFGEMYDLTKTFRFGNKALPGHITRACRFLGIRISPRAARVGGPRPV